MGGAGPPGPGELQPEDVLRSARPRRQRRVGPGRSQGALHQRIRQGLRSQHARGRHGRALRRDGAHARARLQRDRRQPRLPHIVSPPPLMDLTSVISQIFEHQSHVNFLIFLI